ncbi:AAA family ATPase [Clostridium sp.]|uniref:AAA family ATPase n=1 Tax=Clostridium sp. TaxID=1506 RepID=UPI003F3A8140
MIIKKLNIVAFAGISNKTIEFNNGVNLIYGENECGKSTIQNFIRVWLFGMSAKRSKDLKNNDRGRFSPVTGEKISGELYIEDDNGREYVIRRTFGLSKKDDTSEIIDSLTGEEVLEISKNEPGRDLLNVNAATFIRTLFIGQLGVYVGRDKEEEMMEKAANLLSSGDETVSVQKAIEKLDLMKKSLTTTRKSGELDLLRVRYSELLEERYEGIKLSEDNLENEEKNILLKDKRSEIYTELKNLDIYKKYLKKSKLQREYQDITEYLRKSEELKKKERFIEESISVEDEIISERALSHILNENSLYTRVKDITSKKILDLNIKKEEYNEKRKDIEELLFVEDLEEGIKDRLLRATIEQESIKEKIELWNSIRIDIENINNEIQEKKKYIGSAIKFSDIRSEIESLLNEYKDKLRESKIKMENINSISQSKRDYESIKKDFNTNRNTFIVTILLLVASLIFFKVNLVIIIPVSIVCIFFGKKVFNLAIELKTTEGTKGGRDQLELLNNQISEIEERLFSHKHTVDALNYEDFIKKLKLFDDFNLYKEKQLDRIRDKKSQIANIDINKCKKIYNQNLEEFNYIINLARAKDLNQAVEIISRYEMFSKDILSLKIEIENEEENLKRLNEELSDKENVIRNSLKQIGLENIAIEDIEEEISKIREKLAQREEIIHSLASIEEAYKALTKDKNIDDIKEEIKEIINENINFTYKSEEEIDNQIKLKSNELIDIEKNIKDVENEISNRFKGKRTISDIEEDLDSILEEINKKEKLIKAIDLAKSNLEESFREIRSGFSPILNGKVLSYFNKLSGGKYIDVMVSDSYEIKVRDDKNLLSAEIISNGANDQLYLSLRLTFIEMLYDKKNVPVILDDAFVQYDDERVYRVLDILVNSNFEQLIIFTCQKREKAYLEKKSMEVNYIYL